MSTLTGIENNPIIANLLTQANDTGWTINGSIASHQSCNSGYITLLSYAIVAGHSCTVTYTILSISSGYVQAFIGGTGGAHHTSADIIEETIVAGADGLIKLFSNGNCTVQLLNVRDGSINDGVTIVYAAKNRKWSDNRTMYPTFGFSLYERSILEYFGNLYAQQNGSTDRNNFFGEQFQSSIKFVEAKEPALLKTYNSLAIQSNQLMVTTTDGITTSLGQISELSTADFIKSHLNDGVSNVQVSSQEGIFSASFLSDKRFDLLGSDSLKGNFIMIELTTTTGNVVLELYTVAVNTSRSYIGSR